MGKAPLPFDDMPQCTCHAGCPDFKNFTSRYWVVIPNPDRPRLDSGIFMERKPFADNFKDCVWREEPDPGITVTSTLRKNVGFAPVPGEWIWTMVYEEPFFSIFYRAQLTNITTPCGFNLTLPRVQGPLGWLGSTITRIEWFENADDVPH